MKTTSGGDAAEFLVGKTQEPKSEGNFNFSPGPSPQYIKVKGIEGSVYQAKQGFQALNADPKLWLDKDLFFKIEKLQSVTVTGPTPAESFKVFRDTEGGELKLDAPQKGEDFDPSKASGTGSAFSYAAFNDVATAAVKDKTGLDKPTHTAVITTFDGFTYTVKVGNKVAPEAGAAPAEGSEEYYLSFAADGKFEETRTAPPPDKDGKPTETEEQKKTADEAFAKALQTKKDKLAKEQGLKDRVFIVSKSTIDPIVKKRADFKKEVAQPAEGAAAPSQPGVSMAPASPPTVSPSGKIEATTPPISVEIPPAKPEEKSKAK
jgi:hypothetical protein